MSYLPVEPSHVELFKKRFASYWDELASIGRPDPQDTAGWGKINKNLDSFEEQLREDYPCEVEIDLTMRNLSKFLDKYGPCTFYKEGGELKIAILND
jgi:hypothetical protein